MTLLLGIGSVSAQTPPASIWDGIFTAEQAMRGEAAYVANCASCHGTDLRAVNPNAPDLRGPTFDFNWVGGSVGDKFIQIRDTMPASAPRSLMPQVYADIVAYILSVNEAPAGDAELPADEAYLNGIAITAAP